MYISVFFIASFCLLIPTSLGYGTAYINAETKTDGTYYETLASINDEAYYKVFCSAGDSLQVTITYDAPTYDLDLELYTQTRSYEDGSASTGDTDTVSANPYTACHYFIVVNRYDSYGSIPFELYITGATGTETIPGYEVISLLLGVISVIGLVYLQIRRKKKVIT